MANPPAELQLAYRDAIQCLRHAAEEYEEDGAIEDWPALRDTVQCLLLVLWSNYPEVVEEITRRAGYWSEQQQNGTPYAKTRRAGLSVLDTLPASAYAKGLPTRKIVERLRSPTVQEAYCFEREIEQVDHLVCLVFIPPNDDGSDEPPPVERVIIGEKHDVLIAWQRETRRILNEGRNLHADGCAELIKWEAVWGQIDRSFPVAPICKEIADALECVREFHERVVEGMNTQSLLEGGPSTPRPAYQYSADFHSVSWYGKKYSFSGPQAACVRILWQNWENGTPEVGGEYLLEAAGLESGRLDQVFRDNPAWKELIIAGKRKGNYRLAEPLVGENSDCA